MKHILVIITMLLLATGCSTTSKRGAATLQEDKNRSKIVNVDQKIASNAVVKLDTIAGFAFGVDYSLNKVIDPPKEMQVAKDLNQRVMSLSGSPTIEVMKDMQQTIDKLTSILEKERDSGKRMLDQKDKEITSTQNQSKSLLSQKDALIQKYMNDAKDSAANADAYKSELGKMNAWFGLGAVFYGVKMFMTRMMWGLVIFLIVFLILRIAASSNPICSAIFSIFEQMVSWTIHIIQYIFPKAVSMAGNVSSKAYNEVNSLLVKIVDSVEWIKKTEASTGRLLTVKDLLNELDKSLDVSQKEMVSVIKRKLGY